jgi:lysophospholipase L1-like esterase
MGSSLAAGPGVGTRDLGSPPLCMRSSSNYPHLLAAMRGLTLKDVTCSGATTAGILTGQRFLPPQIDAVGPETKLVTVTIGGNDVDLAGNLFALSCANAPEKIPAAWRPWICTVPQRPRIEEGFSRLEDKLLAIVKGIHQRAPRARVIFVDYPQLVPANGSCPDRLPLTEEELAQSRADAARLAAITAKAAKESGAGLVQASEFSRGHDVCATDPWIFPVVFPPHLLDFAPLAYHPNAKAMDAIAGALDKALTAP